MAATAKPAGSETLECKKITVGNVYDMFRQLSKYWDARVMATDRIIVSGKLSAMEKMNEKDNHQIAIRRADELKRICEHLLKYYPLIYESIDHAENKTDGPLRKLIVDRIEGAIKCQDNLEVKIKGSKSNYDSAHAAFAKTVDMKEVQKYAEVITEHEHLKYDLERTIREKEAFYDALEWYDIAYSACETGKISG